MKVVVAIDSLKGCLRSSEAGNIIKEGILEVYRNAMVTVLPLADGGEGTVEALIEGLGGVKERLLVTGPINQKVGANFGILRGTKTAVIEIAQACGLPLVPEASRNPLYTTTYGVGELIKEAISKGCRNFIIGLGGSATNDAGVGMLQALGFKFYDKTGALIGGIGGRVLATIATIDSTQVLPELKDCTFKVACDVNNPLYGENGSAYIYGPQKGATPTIIEVLDTGLKHFETIVKREMHKDIAQVAGVGAAGGLGFAFLAFLNTELLPGIDIIMKEIDLETHMQDADFVITGEGRLDYQTTMGKAPIGVAKIAKKYNVKVIALAGSVSDDAMACNERGIDAYFSIQKAPITLQEAKKKEVATNNMKSTTVQIFNLIKSLNNHMY